MVIVILGVLSAVAIPVFTGKKDFDERGFFDELLQAARYAQKYAVVSNCNVLFSVTSNQFSLSIQPTPEHAHCGTSATALALPGKPQGIYSPPGGITIVGAFSPNFLPSGRASQGGVMQVGTHRLEIHATTGFVERLP